MTATALRQLVNPAAKKTKEVFIAEYFDEEQKKWLLIRDEKGLLRRWHSTRDMLADFDNNPPPGSIVTVRNNTGFRRKYYF